MATVSKPYRLVNPGRKRNPKRMTLKQKLHFGTKRQRTAARASLRHKRTNAGPNSRRKTKKDFR